MESNVSTVAFRSNLYPVEKSFYEDSTFRSKIHDPFSLEILKKQCALTSIQKQEYDYASVHCAYAAKNDYPWGTIRDDQDTKRVVCRCLNTKCSHFHSCRPDFDPAELDIHEENKRAQPAIFEFEEAARKKRTSEDGDARAAAKLFAGNTPEKKNTSETGTTIPVVKKPDPNDPFVVRPPAPPVPKPVEVKKIDFSSFTETTQNKIIEAEPAERSIVNAGPGTGKTWTLIEKIIHMINEEQAEAGNILVLCFSRSAVEVVRNRLADAAEAGRIGYEWQDVDVRTFDSFCTYMLAWVQDNHKELLPRHFLLEEYDYDQRIKKATNIFKQKKDTNNIFGEIDFVILCNEGVLCLEVKGGQVSRRNGVWEFANRYSKISHKNEGPFQQVQGNMQSLRQYMVRRLGNYDPLVRCQYACAVAMPDCRFEAPGVGIDVVPEILVDAKQSWNLDTLINQAFWYWRQTCVEKHGFEGGRLTDAEIDKLANLLRGDFHFVPSMKDTVERAVKELCALTAEQYEVLESLFDNPRTIVSGVAGAGKTLIAMEQARRAYWEGKSVLYLCFNHNIAQYVQYQFEKDNVCIEAVTLHAFMMRACGIDWSPDLNRDFYETELPVAFMAAEDVPVYDLVIIDEGQDLLTDTYLECIDRIVQDGLGDGTWAIYYDPNQNIFNSYAELDAMIKKLRKEAYAMSWKLRANCRNTKQIANANILMTNIPNQGKPTVSGPQVEYDSYSGKEDERKKINAIVRKIKDSGAIGSDFIILSRYTLANPLNGLGLTGLDKDLGTLKTTGPLWKAKKNDVRFSTISGFKGLEAKIVIMIDVDHFSDEDTRLLNYVAASRACAMLYVLYDSDAEQERQNMILSGFTQVGT